MSDTARVAASAASGPPAGARASFAVALLLACAFAFTGLSNNPLRAADEPRVAGIAWEMAHTGNLLVPHLGGEPFLEHPPGYYALLAGMIRLAGSSAGMARVPTAFASLATLLLTYDLARRMAGRSAGLLAVCVLASMGVFFKFSHKVMVDPWLAAAVTLGYWAYARAACEGADEDPPVRLVLLLYAAGVLAFLLKGPVGVILLGGVTGVHALLARRWSFLRSWAHVPGLVLLAVGCAAWPAALYTWAGREIFDAFFWQNVVYRIAPHEDLYTGGHEHPAWFYLLQVPVILAAWVAVLPALAAWVLRGAPPAGWNARLIRFGACVFPLGLLLLSLAGTKRPLYLLPTLPPLAAAIGAWIASTGVVRGGSRIERGTLRAAAALMALLLALPAALVAFAAELARRAGAGARTARLRTATLGALARARLEAGGVSPGRALHQLAALSFAAALVGNATLRNAGIEGRDLRPMALAIAALAGDGSPLVAYQLDEQMRGALPFYTGFIPRNLGAPEEVRRFLAQTPRGLVLLGDYPMPGFERLFPELREIRSWPTAEGVYRLYALGREGA